MRLSTAIKAAAVGLVLLAVSPALGPGLADGRCGPRNMGNRGDMHGGGGSFQSQYFGSAGGCAGCHDGLRDQSGEDVSIVSDWRSTMMANSAKDPFWLAKVSSEMLRSPQLSPLIEERCSRCHMPMASVEASQAGAAIGIFGEGFLSETNPLHPLASEGVSCGLCHQIMGSMPGSILGARESFSGNFRVDTSLAKPYRPLFGPYENPFRMPMLRMSGFDPSYGPHVGESSLCGTCHTLYIPVFEKDGSIKGEAPEQTPYLEWLHSSYGDGRGGDDISCQGCHMPEARGAVRVSRMPHRLYPRDGFRKHHMSGGNFFALSVFKGQMEALGIEASPEELDATIGRTLGLLQDHTAGLRIGKVSGSGGTIEVPLTVTNKTGHKLSTGFPWRRAWVHMTVTDGSGNVVFESGRPEKDGSIAGNDSDRDPQSYEPHYKAIDSPEEVQIYEAIIMDGGGRVTYTLMAGVEHIKENRLLPPGFDKLSAPADIRPHGGAMEDPDFIGGSDTIVYSAAVPGAVGPFTIRASLLFQTMSYAFIKDLSRDSGRSASVERAVGYYERADKSPAVLAAAEAVYSFR